jgi:ubiquinone/menaquinone biosynthesis C-methylase UbiE
VKNSEEKKSLYQMNPLGRFSDRVLDYVKYRPSYPPEAINKIIAEFENLPAVVAADIGAGTGISSWLLAQRGMRVIAIEPNAQMRQVAEAHPQIEMHTGTAEATDLTNQSIDLITCFQSFHWFDPQPTLLEFHRILKPSGRLAIVWNTWDITEELTQQYRQLILNASQNHPAEFRKNSIDSLQNHPKFRNVEHYQFFHQQTFDLAGLIGRTRSISYVPQAGPVYQQLITDVHNFFTQNQDSQGLIQLSYCSDVYLAVPALMKG